MARTVSVKRLREYAEMMRSARVRNVLRALADAVEGEMPASCQRLIDIDERSSNEERGLTKRQLDNLDS